ncbi:MAG: Ycf48-like protein [Frankiales bacterium]|nr:Ycf48-like protein [Frankiales bacterium]
MRRWVTAALLLTAACTTGTHPALPSSRPTASATRDPTPTPTTFRPPTELQLILEDQAVDGSAVLSLVEFCKDTCTTRLYRSTDDERTLGRRSELPQTITRIAAAGATVYGWGGKGLRLWLSHDHGRSWKQSAVAGVTDVLPMIGSVWATTESCEPTCEKVLVGGTADPSTWRPLYRAGSSFKIIRASATTAYGLRTGQRDVTFLRTTDGGRHWVAEPSDCDEIRRCSLSAAGRSTVWLVAGGEPGVGMQLKTFRVTTDTGRHWSRPRNPPAGGYATNVFALSVHTAFLVGGRTSVLGTGDGGRTWQALTPYEEGFSKVLTLPDGTLLAPIAYDNLSTTPVVSVWSRAVDTGRWTNQVLHP